MHWGRSPLRVETARSWRRLFATLAGERFRERTWPALLASQPEIVPRAPHVSLATEKFDVWLPMMKSFLERRRWTGKSRF